ncbi:hypothetical protein CLV31_11587 [Algoriphagus aquaeductus]|uniref:UDP:flavonoid glycosyltransferase YjiC (YdhE family) n=1 Tax=Algoriphagus aquaeductus TaxID=475299 RepID=A0A326RMA4_9BACT|nr:hypothetical protein [Algoriphagus aquaeductus]PZV79127.1 hypothetical protein CLV31_11587 [Algoriphagus aquaeductus]
MRVCLLIPDGIGIRNYLYSDLITDLLNRGNQVILWHSLDPELIKVAEERLGATFEQVPFSHRPNGVFVQLFREAGRFARLRLNSQKVQNPTILSNWTGVSNSFKGKLLNFFAVLLGKSLHSYNSIVKIESLGFKEIKKSSEFLESRRILEEINPDILFCTHQRVFSVTPAIEAARSLGIPTSTAIYSWDNLPKGRLPFRADQYLVWSNYMKDELFTYYPEIDKSQIIVTGSPQFDFYFKNGIIQDREEFGRKYNLDLSKEWVCFSGCDTLTSPDDPKFLRDVAEETFGIANVQLIFRPVPVEPIDRFNQVLKDHPEVKLIEPIWIRGCHWGSYFPLYEDIELLVNLAYHCKVVINMGSTMALDFSTFGNVGLYLRYDHPGVNPINQVETIYKFQHFRSMGDWEAVGFIYSKKEISSQLKRALETPDLIAPDRKKWYQKIVEPSPENPASKRIVDALISIGRN